MFSNPCSIYHRRTFLTLTIFLYHISNLSQWCCSAFGHNRLTHYSRLSTTTMNNSPCRIKSKLQQEVESKDSNLTQETPDHSQLAVKKFHHISVCMVPPIHDNITKARRELRDPGLFRWPPHANLLYPFVSIDSSEDVIERLEDATRSIAPFRCTLETCGTFGGTKRGVLFLHPRSYHDQQNKDTGIEPLIELQSKLIQKFPECTDQLKHGSFTPHITLSHFTSIDEALEGQKVVEEWWQSIEFSVTEIYCLIRDGDGGQFKRLLTLPLGQNYTAIS
jgi:2'-5' RNA ligase